MNFTLTVCRWWKVFKYEPSRCGKKNGGDQSFDVVQWSKWEQWFHHIVAMAVMRGIQAGGFECIASCLHGLLLLPNILASFRSITCSAGGLESLFIPTQNGYGSILCPHCIRYKQLRYVIWLGCGCLIRSGFSESAFKAGYVWTDPSSWVIFVF